MKIQASDLKVLTALCNGVIDRNRKPDESRAAFMERLAGHLKAKHPRIVKPDTAARWQIFHNAIRQPSEYDGQWFGGTMGLLGKLYEYLNDAHIDTALRHITNQSEE